MHDNDALRGELAARDGDDMRDWDRERAATLAVLHKMAEDIAAAGAAATQLLTRHELSGLRVPPPAL